jgi:mRNA-degrading endonuclease toxin of MazEF toxin-antitoxin module
VANVTQVVTLDEDYLVEQAGRIPGDRMGRVEAGLRLVLEL